MRVNIGHLGLTGTEVRQWVSDSGDVLVRSGNGKSVGRPPHFTTREGHCSRKLVLPKRIFLEIDHGRYSATRDRIWAVSESGEDFTCECGLFRAPAIYLDVDPLGLLRSILKEKGMREIIVF